MPDSELALGGQGRAIADDSLESVAATEANTALGVLRKGTESKALGIILPLSEI